MTPTSPCLDCKYRDADKNRKGCVNCEKRLAYVRELEAECPGVPSVVIDGPSLKEARRYRDRPAALPDIAPAVRDTVIDVCRDCGADYRDVTAGTSGRNLPANVVEARRESVRRLMAAGIRPEQVADAMALARSTVYRYAREASIKQTAHRDLPSSDQIMAEACEAHGIARDLLTHPTARAPRVQAARRQVVSVLRNPPFCMHVDQICDVIGMSRPTVRRYVAMVDGSGAPPAPKKKPDEVVEEVCREQGIAPSDLGAPKAKRARILVTARLRGDPYRMSLAEVGKIFGMGFKAVATYTAIAKDEGLLPHKQIHAATRAPRRREAA